MKEREREKKNKVMRMSCPIKKIVEIKVRRYERRLWQCIMHLTSVWKLDGNGGGGSMWMWRNLQKLGLFIVLIQEVKPSYWNSYSFSWGSVRLIFGKDSRSIYLLWREIFFVGSHLLVIFRSIVKTLFCPPKRLSHLSGKYNLQHGK